MQAPVLTAAEIEDGVQLLHPVHGYAHKVESSGLIQPFDFDLPAVQSLRTNFQLRAHDIVIATYPWLQSACV